MNWFNKSQIKNFLVKTAALDWKNQEENCTEFGNFQRYVCDSQTVKVFLTKTGHKWAISLITNHTYLGTAGWSIFWEFELDKQKQATKLFNKVAEISRDTIKEFIKEEKPSVLLHAVLRQKLKEIEREDVIRTNIPIINYSYDIPYETDWRTTIYGPRYPHYEEKSFAGYLNSSLYMGDNAPTGKFAL